MNIIELAKEAVMNNDYIQTHEDEERCQCCILGE
jgi:hypothetical protein